MNLLLNKLVANFQYFHTESLEGNHWELHSISVDTHTHTHPDPNRIPQWSFPSFEQFCRKQFITLE